MRKVTTWAVSIAAVLMALPANAATLTFYRDLGPEAQGATGTGWASATFDTDAVTMRVQATFAGLSGVTTVAHIHCCTAVPFTGNVGVATPTPTFPGFPAGVTAGAYDRTFDLTLPASWNAAFVNANGGTLAGAEAVFAAGLASGRAYLNIHSTYRGGGEIRGFLVPVPEPVSAGLLAVGIGAVAFGRRRRS